MLWITRPLEDAGRLHETLESRGIKCVAAPLLDVDLLSFDLAEDKAIKGLIATSRNGLRGAIAGGLTGALLALPLFVVGPGTAQLASTLGFKDVRVPEEGGGGAVLAGLISQAGLSGKSLLHFRGDKTAYDLRRQLGLHCVQVVECQTYRMIERRDIDPQVREALISGALDGVVLMSPRTARLYGAAMSRAGLADKMAGLKHYCLSDAVAAPLKDWQAHDVEIAAAPDLDALLSLIAAPLQTS